MLEALSSLKLDSTWRRLHFRFMHGSKHRPSNCRGEREKNKPEGLDWLFHPMSIEVYRFRVLNSIYIKDVHVDLRK